MIRLESIDLIPVGLRDLIVKAAFDCDNQLLDSLLFLAYEYVDPSKPTIEQTDQEQ